MKKVILMLTVSIFSLLSFAATESTSFGKITGIESRSWGMHVQTTFADGDGNGCPVAVGDTYMYDFRHDASYNGEDSSDEVAMLLAAYAAQSDVAFHVYECNEAKTRPLIGYIRLRK